MSASSDHHIKGPRGCQFSQWFWSFKVQIRKSIIPLTPTLSYQGRGGQVYSVGFYSRDLSGTNSLCSHGIDYLGKKLRRDDEKISLIPILAGQKVASQPDTRISLRPVATPESLSSIVLILQSRH